MLSCLSHSQPVPAASCHHPDSHSSYYLTLSSAPSMLPPGSHLQRSLGLKAQFKSNTKQWHVNALYDELRRNLGGDKALGSIPSTKEKNYFTAKIPKHLCVPRSVIYLLLTMESTPFCSQVFQPAWSDGAHLHSWHQIQAEGRSGIHNEFQASLAYQGRPCNNRRKKSVPAWIGNELLLCFGLGVSASLCQLF